MSERSGGRDGERAAVAGDVVGQPLLHDLVVCVQAPVAVLSTGDGQIHADGAQGLLRSDTRHLSRLVVTVDGREPLGVGHRLETAATAGFVGIVRGVGDPIADPTVRIERRRTATGGGVDEEVRVVNDGRSPVRVVLAVQAEADMAAVDGVKEGKRFSPVPADATGSTVTWAAGGWTTVLAATPAPTRTVGDADHPSMEWLLDLPARSDVVVRVEVSVSGPPGAAGFAAPGSRSNWAGSVSVRSPDPHLGPLVERSLSDLSGLLLADGDAGTFAAAGSPWYFTLFGRDSLWAASFALPVGVELAHGTLKVLARRQGRVHDPATGEEPGKILHEVRGPAGLPGDRRRPTPVYFGTIDAAPLWISLLHDAWAWGLPTDRVAELAEPLAAALDWVTSHGDPGRSGFLAYHDVTGDGLANQGWKDSGDSIQDAAGVIAPPPITLCEAQAYAHRAALDGARLLDALDRPGGERARAFAADLARRFRDEFWVDGPAGTFPAVAIDGGGHRVDSLTSNIGHLLLGGLLDEEEVACVVRWLADPRLSSGYGLRTLDATHPYFNPLGYHSGSVWPHDTAIVIGALRDAGHPEAAAHLTHALLVAAHAFDYRLPELFGGWPAADGPVVAYPAACRPQAWSAAAALVLVRAALGLRVDVPAGTLTVTPDPTFAGLYPLEVRGLRVAGHRLDITVRADGRADVVTDAPLRVLAN